MKRRFILGFAGILAVYLMLNGYIGWLGAKFMEAVFPGFPQAVLWVLLYLAAFSYILGRLRVPVWMQPASRLLKVIGSFYFALFEFALILLPLAQLAGWLLGIAGLLPQNYTVIAGWTVLGTIIALMLAGSRNAWSPVVRSYTLRIGKQAGGMDRLRIMAASDIHLGNIVGKRHLKRLIAHAEKLAPDLILLPGDVIDDSIEPFLRHRLNEWMGKLKEKARYGAYAVLGNHEYYGGHIGEYVDSMKAAGIPVLRDEMVTIGGAAVIAGRKDKTAETLDSDGRLTPEELLKQADKSRLIIMMDHQPLNFDKAAAAGVDLLLCGHTHRGQFAPNHWLTRRLFELDWGYMAKGAMHVIVSSGFGTWGPPIRLASRSEIVMIDVVFEK